MKKPTTAPKPLYPEWVYSIGKMTNEELQKRYRDEWWRPTVLAKVKAEMDKRGVVPANG